MKTILQTDILLDDDTCELIGTRKLSVNKRTGYVTCKFGQSTQYIHRIVMQAPKGFDVDHINGNKLDNRRTNLRLATRSQNNINKKRLVRNNTSGVCGVSWSRSINKWDTYIQVHGKLIRLGYYTSLDEAKQARKTAEVKYYGAFANA